AQPIVITGATVHTVTGGDLDDGWVLFESGRIVAVGRGEPPRAAGAEVISAAGLHVWPGLISTATTLGLIETAMVTETRDERELGQITPEVRAAVAINPDTDLIPVARANGILTAMILPSGGLVAGRCSTIRLDGWTWEDMAIEPEAGLVVHWPRTEPEARILIGAGAEEDEKKRRKEITESLRQIDDVFDDAAAWLQARSADSAQENDLRFEAMRPAIGGDAPVFIVAHSRGQIESAIAWASRRGLKLVIVGGYDADLVIPALRANDVSVIISGIHRLPDRRDDPYDRPFRLPAVLYEAGIRFAIASGDAAAHERNLPYQAATAVAYGLPKQAAIEAITIRAAEIIGLGATHGSIEPGKAATLIVTTGDPLQITTDTVLAFID
ncbi:MAG: amidohydrolase family protein, partial [Chloroflexi bacterium]|nr:amidohydrolase family protein [Chloroflexota bacterium]